LKALSPPAVFITRQAADDDLAMAGAERRAPEAGLGEVVTCLSEGWLSAPELTEHTPWLQCLIRQHSTAGQPGA